MNAEAFITCAVTGAGDTSRASDRVPVSPSEIADSAIEAARAGAAVVHIHVRDAATGRGSRDVALYREVVERVRGADVDAVVNLTAGMGGDLVLGGEDAPLPVDPSGTDMIGACAAATRSSRERTVGGNGTTRRVTWSACRKRSSQVAAGRPPSSPARSVCTT